MQSTAAKMHHSNRYATTVLQNTGVVPSEKHANIPFPRTDNWSAADVDIFEGKANDVQRAKIQGQVLGEGRQARL